MLGAAEPLGDFDDEFAPFDQCSGGDDSKKVCKKKHQPRTGWPYP